MAGLRQVWYTGRDAYAGSANLLGKTEYLSRKPIKVSYLEDAELERVAVSLHVAAVLKIMPEKAQSVLDAQARVTPDAVSYGRFLVEEGWLEKMVKADFDIKAAYENLLYLFKEKFLKRQV